MPHRSRTIEPMHSIPVSITAVATLAVAMGLIAGLAGCRGSSALKAPQPETQPVALDDFADPDAPAPVASTTTETDRGSNDASPAAFQAPLLATNQSAANQVDVPVIRVVPQPRSTPMDASSASPIDRPVIIDAKVGDINGRPIYAGDFLEPIAARLEAEATRQGILEWRPLARELIRRELESLIEDELLRAEAISSLDPQQRAGLVNFLEQIRGNVIRRTGGSAVLASQRIQAETGQDVEQFLDDQRTRELIRYQLEQAVDTRVNVRWRDIVLEYERQWELFNPPAKVNAVMLRVSKARTEEAAEIQRRIDAGDDWGEIATETANTHARGNAGQILPVPEFRGDITEAELFANATINEALRALQPGDSTGPLEIGTQLIWLRMNSIEQDTTSLYEAQLRIERFIRQVRETEERARYVERLKGRASLTNEDEIVSHLLSIAEERHGPNAVRRR